MSNRTDHDECKCELVVDRALAVLKDSARHPADSHDVRCLMLIMMACDPKEPLLPSLFEIEMRTNWVNSMYS